MLNTSISDNAILRDFLSFSHWETIVAVVLFYAILIPFFVLVTKYKIRFMYRVLLGLALGLIFGVVLQSVIKFPEELTYKDAAGNEVYYDKYDWVGQFNVWAQLWKQIFINGILLLTVPVVFLAIFRVTSKVGNKGMRRITGKGIAILLIGVAIAFTITFWMGYGLKVGHGVNLDSQPGGKDPSGTHETKSIPQIIWGYVPSNFISTLARTAIIPVIVVAAIMGRSIRFMDRRHPEAVEKLRFGVDRAWDIVMSMLMTFMKVMPMAVMSMITVAVTSRPIEAKAPIGKVIGVGYLGIIAVMIYMTVALLIFGVKIGPWWKAAWRPLLQGFATQSSNAALPVSMDTMENDMKINEEVVSIMGPLSTSMGLIACAGVQSGLITSFLWTGSQNVANGFSGGIDVFFIMSLVICLIASLGLAGIPGTATVVTSGVLSGLGYASMFAPVYGIIGALDGLFDMGRTGANVLGGILAATLAAKSEGQLDDNSPLIGAAGWKRQEYIRYRNEIVTEWKEAKQAAFNTWLKNKQKRANEIQSYRKDNAALSMDEKNATIAAKKASWKEQDAAAKATLQSHIAEQKALVAAKRLAITNEIKALKTNKAE